MRFGLLFIVFMAFCILALLNVITGAGGNREGNETNETAGVTVSCCRLARCFVVFFFGSWVSWSLDFLQLVIYDEISETT